MRTYRKVSLCRGKELSQIPKTDVVPARQSSDVEERQGGRNLERFPGASGVEGREAFLGC